MATIRDAVEGDLPALVRLLAQLSDAWPDVGDDHRKAFAAVRADARQRLLVVEHDGAVAGSAALIIIPNLGRDGRQYAIVENVVVDETLRGQRLGELLMRYVVEQARAAGCYKVALTSRKHREDAPSLLSAVGVRGDERGLSVGVR